MATNRKFQSIGSVNHLPDEVRKVLIPIIDAVQRRLLIGSGEKMVSQAQLIELGLVTQSQLDNLENQ